LIRDFFHGAVFGAPPLLAVPLLGVPRELLKAAQAATAFLFARTFFDSPYLVFSGYYKTVKFSVVPPGPYASLRAIWK
jgi:hypothetical protein